MAMYYKYDGGITYSQWHDYYEYNDFTFPDGGPSSISNNVNMINSGIRASVKRKNPHCGYAKLDLSGVCTRPKKYVSIWQRNEWEWPDDAPTKDYSKIQNYNHFDWACTLITPKHVLVTQHVFCEDWACPRTDTDWGHGANIVEFMNEDGVGITAELDTDNYYSFGASYANEASGQDLAIIPLKQPIPADSGIRIYPLIASANASPELGHGFPRGMILCGFGPQGIIAHSVNTKDEFVSSSAQFERIKDDHQGTFLLFGGDSGTPMFIHSKSHGTVLNGVLRSPQDYRSTGGANRLWKIKDEYQNSFGVSGADEFVFADGGYTLNWVYADDWMTVDEMLTLGTGSSYIGSTAMNGKELICEITATRANIRGSDLTSTVSKKFTFSASGDRPPYDGFTGKASLSTSLAKNSLYEGRDLDFIKEADNIDWTSTFPPVTAFANIAFGSTLQGGNSGGTITSIGTNGSTLYGTYIPEGVAGMTMYVSFFMENVLGSTGDQDQWVELGKANTYGWGPTFNPGSFSWSDETPSPGDTIIGSVSGWTANPDRGLSSVQHTGIGFDMPSPSSTFTGPTFGITIPGSAQAGDPLLVTAVNYQNVYGNVLALNSQLLTIS